MRWTLLMIACEVLWTVLVTWPDRLLGRRR
jgi:hypothetical protein